MKLYTQNMFRSLPWKNGGGITKELLIKPHDSEFNLRLSVAKIEKDGPFSFYPGYDRHLLILEGNGIDIKTGSENRRLSMASEAFFFKGEASITANLVEGSVTDFNVMIKRDWGEAKVHHVKTGERVFCSNDNLYVFSFDKMELIELNRGEEYTANVNSITVEIKLLN